MPVVMEKNTISETTGIDLHFIAENLDDFYIQIVIFTQEKEVKSLDVRLRMKGSKRLTLLSPGNYLCWYNLDKEVILDGENMKKVVDFATEWIEKLDKHNFPGIKNLWYSC